MPRPNRSCPAVCALETRDCPTTGTTLQTVAVEPDVTLKLNSSGRVLVAELPTALYDRYATFTSSTADATAVTNAVYRHFGDQFDFGIYVINETNGRAGGTAGEAYSVSNRVDGIGIGAFDNTALYGSGGRLRGVVQLATRDTIASHTVLFHEFLHTWGVDLEGFGVGASGGSHWGFASGGYLGGWQPGTLRALGGGRYDADSPAGISAWGRNSNSGLNEFPISQMELYLMGLLGPDEVTDPIQIAVNPSEYSGLDGTFRADSIRTLTMADVVAENGARVPSVATSQKDFRGVAVLISDGPVTQAELDEVDNALQQRAGTGPDASPLFNFWEATGGRGTLTLDGLASLRLPANVAPAAFDVPNRQVATNGTSGPVAFSVSDPDASPTLLTLTAESSNPALVPVPGVVFGGAGANRTVTVTPAAGQTGTATITVRLADRRGGVRTDTFVVTVSPPNAAPTLTAISDATIGSGRRIGPLPFTVGDAETAADDLSVSLHSSNPSLVSVGSAGELAGAGANRTLTLLPLANGFGTATVTVTVTDGAGKTASRAFTLTVLRVLDRETAADGTFWFTTPNGSGPPALYAQRPGLAAVPEGTARRVGKTADGRVLSDLDGAVAVHAFGQESTAVAGVTSRPDGTLYLAGPDSTGGLPRVYAWAPGTSANPAAVGAADRVGLTTTGRAVAWQTAAGAVFLRVGNAWERVEAVTVGTTVWFAADPSPDPARFGKRVYRWHPSSAPVEVGWADRVGKTADGRVVVWQVGDNVVFRRNAANTGWERVAEAVRTPDGAVWFASGPSPDPATFGQRVYRWAAGGGLTEVGWADRVGLSRDNRVVVWQVGTGAVFVRAGAGWQSLPAARTSDGAVWFVGPDAADGFQRVYGWPRTGAGPLALGLGDTISATSGGIRVTQGSKVFTRAGLSSPWVQVP